MEIVGSRWKKRDIQIVTDYSVKAKITLWEEFGEKFNPYLYKNDSGMYIVIVTATAVKEFRGEVSFATSYASKIYINLNVDYITSLIQMFATVSAGVQTIERSNVNSIPIEEEMSFNKMNIKELLDCDWEYIVTMRGEITKIDNHFGWYYISCNACSKKIEAENSVYNCHICNKECKFPLVKYKIHLKVKNKTGESSVVLFNLVAEKLLDTSTHKLLNRLPLDNNDVPIQIQSLCKKEFIFKLKLNNYNLQEGLENFTVSKVFVPVENLEIQYQSRKDKKGKSLLEDENEPKEQKTKRLIKKKKGC